MTIYYTRDDVNIVMWATWEMDNKLNGPCGEPQKSQMDHLEASKGSTVVATWKVGEFSFICQRRFIPGCHETLSSLMPYQVTSLAIVATQHSKYI